MRSMFLLLRQLRVKQLVDLVEPESAETAAHIMGAQDPH